MSKIEINEKYSVIEQQECDDHPYTSLPPPHAFKEPEKWLRPLSDHEKITLPVDDRGFVKIDESMQLVLDLFAPSYQWEYDPNVPETKPDKHHLYPTKNDFLRYAQQLKEKGFQDYNLPIRFRNNPANLIVIPGLVHNFLHHGTKKPGRPEHANKKDMLVKLDYEDMQEYLINYTLAHRALSTAHNSALGILKWEQLATLRTEDIERRPEIIKNKDGIDTIGQEIINDTLNRYFRGYNLGMQAIQGGVRLDLVLPPGEDVKIEQPTLHQIIQIGQRSVREAINYMSLFRDRDAA